ncbi:hypothetical protein GCM10008106_23450 [Mongoliitalea lutea]|uniref:TonB C-terminal domain-containing protein n=2 Tax=Mongoliitalea lutea TaxID=849756 RepID=A0A8J3CYC9_9BACT|nr:hypothetical protein GCM10008106_23450 [Mongoliitalea lutea]
MIKTASGLSELILTFTMDTVKVFEKREDKNEEGTVIKKIQTEYTDQGALKARTVKDLLTSTNSTETFFLNGHPKSKTTSKAGTIVEELYFDEDGQELSKATKIAPLPKGNMQGWYKYLANNMRMPEDVKRSGLNETVYVKFEVATDGSLDNIHVLNPEEVHTSISKEAIRLLTKYPHQWTPGTLNGVATAMDMILPLRFKYGN